MKNKIKPREIEVLRFWNDTHNLTMLFEPIEEPEPIPPEPIVPAIPTNILLTEIVLSLPEIPTSINVKYYANS